MNPTLNDLGKILKQDKVKADKSQYGVVKDLIINDEGITVGYRVSLGGEDDLIDCRKFAGADVGDVVMVTLMANGSMVVTGRRDGDGDTLNFIQGTQDGTVNINGGCLEMVGKDSEESASDHITIGKNAIGLVGTETALTLSSGSLTLTHVGEENESMMRVKSAITDTATFSSTVWLPEPLASGTNQRTVTFPIRSAISKVIVKLEERVTLLFNYENIEITQDPNDRIYYEARPNDDGVSTDVTVYIKHTVALGKRTIKNVEVTFDTADDYIFELGEQKVYADANGNMYAKSFTQVNPPVLSNAPSGGNGSDTAGSSRTVKHDIKPCDDVSALYDIEVVNFKFNEDYLDENDERQDKEIVGLIAEQVDEVFPIAVDHKDIPMWNSQILIPAMLKLIQDQHKEIEQLKEIVNGLQ